MLATKQFFQFAAVAFGTAILCFTGGCGNSSSTGVVEGSVVFQGKPVFPAIIYLKSDSGKSYSGKLSNDGKFKVGGVEPGVYAVSLDPIKLGSAGRPPRGAAVADPDSPDKPANREEAVPAQYQAANNNFPAKYKSLTDSGLSVDCSNGFPESPVEIVLK